MRFIAFLVLSLLLNVLTSSARADEKEDFAFAQKALDTAPAYRATGVAVTPEGPGKVVLEVARPDFARMKIEHNGKPDSEFITDGKRTVVSESGGAYKEASTEQAAPLAVCRRQMSVVAETSDDFTHKVARMKAAGHETINGVPTSLYTGDDTAMGLHVEVKFWISDDKHLPVRWVYKAHGKLKIDPQDEGDPIEADLTVDFDYPPSIEIAMPAVG